VEALGGEIDHAGSVATGKCWSRVIANRAGCANIKPIAAPTGTSALSRRREAVICRAHEGLVAEWLRAGLQIRLPRFDSGRGLQFFPFIPMHRPCPHGATGRLRPARPDEPAATARGMGPAMRKLAASALLWPEATRRASSARLFNVNRAFLWMFIRSSSTSLSSRNNSFLDLDRMDSLLKAHSHLAGWTLAFGGLAGAAMGGARAVAVETQTTGPMRPALHCPVTQRHGPAATPAPDQRKVDRQHQEAQRNHPEADNRQEAEDATNDQRRADHGAGEATGRQRKPPVADADTAHGTFT
jgi:hypothetical protein